MPAKKINIPIFILLLGFSLFMSGILASGSYRITTVDYLSVDINPIKTNTYMRDSIVHFAISLSGTPYVAAGCSKNGFDCSGLVYYVFQHFNIMVPRTSSQFATFGKEIAIENVRKGDVLVFLSPTRNAIGHVGIVIDPKGKESDFIHASSGHEMKVMISSLKQEGYTRRFVKAVDVISPL